MTGRQPAPSPKRCLLCECAACSAVYARGGERVFSLEFTWEGPSPEAGQFFMVKPLLSAVFLGRPLSAAGFTPPRAGTPGRVRFLVARRGDGTAELVDRGAGFQAELTGPLGRSWAAAASLTGPTGPFALVSGGVGVAPLAFFASALGAAPGTVYDFYAGFRGGAYGLDALAPRALVVTSEDGSSGRPGRVTDFFDPAPYAAVFSCGPEPMLAAVAASCAASGVPCFVSLERRMACGVGACLGCAVTTAHGYRQCCVDGPVFDAREIFFEGAPHG